MTEEADGARGRRAGERRLTSSSPALGTLDLRLVEQPGGAASGDDRGGRGAAGGAGRPRGGAARATLAAATGLPTTVRVVGRAPKPRVDFYA